MTGALTRRRLVTGVVASVAAGGALAEVGTPRTRPGTGKSATFEVERFVDDCRHASATPDPRGAVLDVLARSISQPAAVLRGVGEPMTGGINTWYCSRQLTVLNIVWSPLMQLMPHEHRMWSVIGIYTGREDNIFWRRHGDSVTAVQARALAAGEPIALDADVIHSVTNPTPKLTGAIHIYGGDFFARPRSEWDPETLTERPWDVRQAMRIFKDANERFAAWQSARSCA